MQEWEPLGGFHMQKHIFEQLKTPDPFYHFTAEGVMILTKV